jgi:hypothetical protein
MMIQLFIRIKEVFFAVRLRMVWLVPVFVNLFLNPYFPPLVQAANVAKLSENQGQKQTTLKNSQMNLPDLSVKDPFLQPLIIYDGPGGKLLKVKIKADILETFKPDIDIFQNKSSESDETFFSSRSDSNESANRLEIFRLVQKLDGFNCGLEYRYVAKNLNYFNRYKNKTETKTKVDLKNDQEGVEIWGEKNIGSIGLKTFFSRFLNNVDRDPTLPRMLTHKYGLEMKYKMDFLPIWVSFSHLREESENIFEIGSAEYLGIQKETYNSSLKYYGGTLFDITASSSYSLSHDLFHSNQETVSLRNGIRSSIHPASDLTITPMLSVGEYRYLWYGEHEINPSASLFITYRRIFNVADLSFGGRYSQTSHSDQSLDNETLSTTIGLTWNAKNLFSRKIDYALNLGFNQYLYKIQPDSSYSSLSASFKLEFQL